MTEATTEANTWVAAMIEKRAPASGQRELVTDPIHCGHFNFNPCKHDPVSATHQSAIPI